MTETELAAALADLAKQIDALRTTTAEPEYADKLKAVADQVKEIQVQAAAGSWANWISRGLYFLAGMFGGFAASLLINRKYGRGEHVKIGPDSSEASTAQGTQAVHRRAMELAKRIAPKE